MGGRAGAELELGQLCPSQTLVRVNMINNRDGVILSNSWPRGDLDWDLLEMFTHLMTREDRKSLPWVLARVQGQVVMGEWSHFL